MSVRCALKQVTTRRSGAVGPGRARFKSTRPELASSVIDNASDFLAALRYKAANALTASLSQQERAKLLARMQPELEKSSENNTREEDDTIVMKNSIAEAVAAARLEEAQRMEKEKKKWIEQAEKAATARMESQLAIQQRRVAFEEWQKKVESEKEGNNGKNPEASTTSEKFDDEAHPVLGPVVADLGYKRVHLVSAEALSSIPVWEKQRIYRHDRAKTMANDKMKTLHLGMPGVIALHEDTNGDLCILDGQHRVGMMTILNQKRVDGIDLERILVEVYSSEAGKASSFNGEEENNEGAKATAKDLFVEVNKAEPVKLVDMPGVAKASDRKAISTAAERLKDRFPEMFKASQRCRAPHMNVDNLRDSLFAANIIDRHGLRSAKALEAWMMEQNQVLKEKYSDPAYSVDKVSNAALEKAKKFDFFLGLDATWYTISA